MIRLVIYIAGVVVFGVVCVLGYSIPGIAVAIVGMSMIAGAMASGMLEVGTGPEISAPDDDDEVPTVDTAVAIRCGVCDQVFLKNCQTDVYVVDDGDVAVGCPHCRALNTIA